MDSSIHERLKEARGNLGRDEFAEILGVHKNTLGRYERGESEPTSGLLALLCTKFGISPQWLLFGAGEMKRDQVGENEVPNDVEMIRVPKVKARLSAGNGSLETSGEIEQFYAFRSDWLNRKCSPGKCVVMDVAGDSMDPIIKDKDIVLIDKGQDEVIAGNIYAIGIDDGVLVKYVDKEPGMYVFRSANQAYSSIRVDLNDESLNVRIIGRVLWMGREL